MNTKIKKEQTDFMPIDLTANVTGVLPVANGGTGGTGGNNFNVNADEAVTTWSTNPMIPIATLGWTIAGIPVLGANAYEISGNATGSARIALYGIAGSTNVATFGSGTWRARIKATVIPVADTDTNTYSFFGLSNTSSMLDVGDITNVSDRVGLSFYNGKIYFITANGTSVTATEIATRASRQWDVVIVDFDNTTARVWLNGTAYTSTTNVPNSSSAYVNFGGYDGGGAAAGLVLIAPTISTQYNA